MAMLDRSQIANLVADLVRIESINPELVPGGSGEAAVARFVAGFLEPCGFEVKLQDLGPGRMNAVGVLRGKGRGKGRAPSGEGRSLMFNGHLDTVGVAGMAEPFAARIEGGRLYGRGAQDMKGGVAAALAAAAEVARTGGLGGDLIVAGVADEEYKSLGTRALLREFRAAAAVVTEPTGLEIATAHKGFVWAEVTTFGKAAHGSRPAEGVDAIAMMGRVLVETERLERMLASRPAHQLLGCGSVHASLISGGQELSSYPAECRLSLERRLLPGENGKTFEAELGEILARLSGQDPGFRACCSMGYAAEALETPRDAAIAAALGASAGAVIGERARFGAQSFWTDAALLAEAGIPSVLFGPGGAGLHSASEYVVLEDVALCAEALVRCAREFCGVL